MIGFHRIPFMNVLVTGGTGFIGSHLIDSLAAVKDARVAVLVRDPGRLRWLAGKSNIEILQGDLFSVPSPSFPLDIVFHLAGLTKALKSNDYYTVNQKGTASLLRSLRGMGMRPRFIHLSSLAAGGPSAPGHPAREDDPPKPVSPYGMSKLLSEDEALKYRDEMEVVVLRIAAVFGPRDEDFLDYFRMIRKGWLPSVGRERKFLSLVYVGDVVRALQTAAAAAEASGEIFNIADPRPYAWEDLGRAASREMNCSVRPLRVPVAAADIAGAFSEALSRPDGETRAAQQEQGPRHEGSRLGRRRRKSEKTHGIRNTLESGRGCPGNDLLVLPSGTAPGARQSFLTGAARVVKAAENLDVVL